MLTSWTGRSERDIAFDAKAITIALRNRELVPALLMNHLAIS